MERSEIPGGQNIRKEEEGAVRKRFEMRTGGRVWLDIIQAEEGSAGIGYSDILGLSAFQNGGTKQEGVVAARAVSPAARANGAKVRGDLETRGRERTGTPHMRS